MKSLKEKLVKLAYDKKELRHHLLPILAKEAGDKASTPEGAKKIFEAYKKKHPGTKKQPRDFFDASKAKGKGKDKEKGKAPSKGGAASAAKSLDSARSKFESGDMTPKDADTAIDDATKHAESKGLSKNKALVVGGILAAAAIGIGGAAFLNSQLDFGDFDINMGGQGDGTGSTKKKGPYKPSAKTQQIMEDMDWEDLMGNMGRTAGASEQISALIKKIPQEALDSLDPKEFKAQLSKAMADASAAKKNA